MSAVHNSEVGGCLIACSMRLSICSKVHVLYREFVHFWKGPFSEAPLFYQVNWMEQIGSTRP